MHEVSLIRTIFQTLESEFSASECATITAIDLKVGLLSNVEPQLMQNAFAAVQESTGQFPGVELCIELVPIAIFCDTCQKESPVEQYRFVCQHCSQTNSNVIRGTELLIHRVHFQSPEAAS